jgi:hypothetical protein
MRPPAGARHQHSGSGHTGANQTHEEAFLNMPVAELKLLHHQESTQCAYQGASLPV